MRKEALHNMVLFLSFVRFFISLPSFLARFYRYLKLLRFNDGKMMAK